jgi:hypothetical protein
VNLEDRGNDRQPQARAVIRSGSLGADTPERLGELFDLVGVKDRAAVLDDELRALVLDRGPDADPAERLLQIASSGCGSRSTGAAGSIRSAAARAPATSPKRSSARG